MKTTTILLLDLFFYICYFGKLQVSCDVPTSYQNIVHDKPYNKNDIEGKVDTANENNKDENEESLDYENYITIKNLHDLKNEWFANEKAKNEQNKSKGAEKILKKTEEYLKKTEEDLKKTEENLKETKENLTSNNNKDVENMELCSDEPKKETGCFRAHTKNVNLENVNNSQNDKDLDRNDNINKVSAAEEESFLERLNNEYKKLNTQYINKVEKNAASVEDFYDNKMESNYLQNMSNVTKSEDKKGSTENLVNYTVKFTEDDDSDLKVIAEKIKNMNKKFVNTTVNCFNNVKSKLKTSLEKNKSSLKKLKTKIVGTFKDIYNPNAVNVLLLQAENYLIEINSRLAAKESFEMNDYILNLHRISIHIFNRLKENEDAILPLITKINERLELTAIQLAFSDAGLESELCVDTDNTIAKYITFIKQQSFFSIGYDNTKKILYPKLTKIVSGKVEDYIEGKVEALCNTQCVTLVCPPNSNCYHINGKEECRCFPGFAPVNSEGKFECVKKDTVDCEINNGGCDKNANCLVVDNTVKCECKEGFTGDGLYCSFSQMSSSINTIVIFILCLFCLYFL